MKSIKYIQDANSGLTIKMETSVTPSGDLEIITTVCNEIVNVNGNMCVMPFEIPHYEND